MIINDLPLIMVRCLLVTIISEVMVALILKVRRKDLIYVILVNIMTNPIVVSLPFYINIKYGLSYRNYLLIFLEISTVILEGLIYKKTLNYKKINWLLLSFILNLFSYLIGEVINILIT